jgi:hypothetical protein
VVIRILSGAAFEISGVVVDDGGNPVSGAMVSVTSDPSRGSVLFGGPGMNQSRTDTHGRFVIAGIPDGEYILNAAAPLVMSNGASSGGTGGVGGFTAWSTSGVIGPSGPAGGSIVTEMRNGTTIQFRTDPATAQHLTVNGANVTGVQLVARRPAP